MKVLLTVEQAAGRLQITPYTVRRWINEGKLHAVKPGRAWRIPEESLGDLLKSNAIQTSPLSDALEMAQKRDARQNKSGETFTVADNLETLRNERLSHLTHNE